MVVEPESLCWMAGKLSDKRDGSSWAEQFGPLSNLKYLVTDGGSGLLNGIKLVRERRAAQARAAGAAEPRPLSHGLDVFHIKQEAGRASRKTWSAAQRFWEQAEELNKKLRELNSRGKSLSGYGNQAKLAWNRAEQAFAEADRSELARRRAEAALEWFTPDGRLNTRRHAAAEIAAALCDLTGPAWAKTRRMLSRPETLTFLDRVHEQLSGLGLEPATLSALPALEHLSRRPALLQGDTFEAAARRGLWTVRTVQLHKADPNWQEQAARVRAVLRNSWRASSLVECINSVARMQQSRHRKMTQGLLDLKRLYWNLRRFRTGLRKDRSPYEMLGLPLPQMSWWELLQLTPAELQQHLSAPQVAK